MKKVVGAALLCIGMVVIWMIAVTVAGDSREEEENRGTVSNSSNTVTVTVEEEES